MNIGEFRAIMDAALEAEGLEPVRIVRPVKAWSYSGGDIVRFFHPQAVRRPWGFIYDGFVGVEIPTLRAWLNRHKSKEQTGIFHSCFAGYHTANEDILRDFMIEFGDPVPADLWGGLIKDRLVRIPETLEELIRVYRTERERLGELAHPHNKPAWDFLLRWRGNPDPALPVPQMLPDGRIF